MFAFKDILFNICFWFTDIELTAKGTITRDNTLTKLIQHIYFPHQAHHNPLRHTIHHLGTIFGGDLKQQNHQLKTKPQNTWHYIDHKKHLFIVGRSSATSFNWEHAPWLTIFLLFCECLLIIQRALWVLNWRRCKHRIHE